LSSRQSFTDRSASTLGIARVKGGYSWRWADRFLERRARVSAGKAGEIEQDAGGQQDKDGDNQHRPDDRPNKPENGLSAFFITGQPGGKPPQVNRNNNSDNLVFLMSGSMA
jgi:hypothetical protein